MLTKSFLLALTAAVLCSIPPAHSQMPPNLPDGAGKEAVVTYCSGVVTGSPASLLQATLRRIGTPPSE
ncbi:MAG: hypothetical protein HYW03_03855 [Deltaproteobacteria bacterium]|nr:hypothetical protein [Deltaproteobacteria bacterium]MBI2531336.1 hypothetical protein [Deltaproteobacteria bacterium]